MSLLAMLSLMVPAQAATVAVPPGSGLCTAISGAAAGTILNLSVGSYELTQCTIDRLYNSSFVHIRKDPDARAGDVVLWVGSDSSTSNSYDYLLRMKGGVHLKFSNVTITGAVKSAILNEGGTLALESVTIQQPRGRSSTNPSGGGGAIKLTGEAHLIATEVTFADFAVGGSSTSTSNDDDGAALYLDSDTSDLSCSRCTFTNLSADSGAAIYAKRASSIQITDSTFSSLTGNGNGGDTTGGAIYFGAVASASISGSTFNGTTSTNNATGQVAYGGAIYVAETVAFTLSNTVFNRGSADDGGFLFFNNTNTATLTNASFTEGTALTGGCLASRSNDPSDALTLTTSSFETCVSTGTSSPNSDGGGAFYAWGAGSLTIDDTDFLRNTATLDGGAGQISLGGTVAVTGGVWCSNTAGDNTHTGDGGALWVNTGSTTHIQRSIFNANSATGTGGAVHLSGDDGYIVQSYLTGNHTTSDGAALWVNGVGGTFLLESSLVAWQKGGVPLKTSGSFSEDYNDFYNNAGGYVPTGANDWLVDPSLVAADGVTPVTDPTPTCVANNLQPTPLFSPLLDAGNPNGVNPPYTLLDIDSTPNIGPFPGEGTDPADEDGDGLVNTTVLSATDLLVDCDDSTKTIGGRTAWYPDADTDTFGDKAATATYALAKAGGTTTTTCPETVPTTYTPEHTDCDDSEAAVNPSALEVCNSIDDNCNGVVDEATATDAKLWYLDGDGDTYGKQSDPGTRACNQPLGAVATHTDCDDTKTAVHPYADELCSTAWDDNCDTSINESTATDASTWWPDNDGDTFGDKTSPGSKSCSKPAGWVGEHTDCNDNSASLNPNTSWYPDSDRDTYGSDSAPATLQCEQPPNSVLDHTDCDDTSGAISPATVWYEDKDGDTYGNPAKTKAQCSKPNNYVANSLDCNDNDPNVGGTSLWFRDGDGDSYGDPTQPSTTCGDPGVGWVANQQDCDDKKASFNPGAFDVCGDGMDQNCDGLGGRTGDDDKDGLTWTQEDAVGSNDCNLDSDNDGVSDTIEYGQSGRDTDGDGIRDLLDPDDDGDSVPTRTERGTGSDVSTRDADGDGVLNYLDGDDDGDGVCTNVLAPTNPLSTTCIGSEDRNADHDPRNDDLDHDGIYDYLDPDDDGDGIPNLTEIYWRADPLNADTDGDGIPDGAEWDDWIVQDCTAPQPSPAVAYDGIPCRLNAGPQDFDGDGVADMFDDDDDNDGIPTLLEGPDDIDADNAPVCPIDGLTPPGACMAAPDGIPNYHDDDSDGDSLPDSVEGLDDADGDGVYDSQDCHNCDGCSGDPDGDTLGNCFEASLGTNPNRADTDGDGFGDLDELAGATSVADAPDTDGDGLLDVVDPDDDGDGVSTYIETHTNPDGSAAGFTANVDTDGDGIPDRFDVDDDGDGLLTIHELRDDTDSDGVRDRLDNDDDGDGKLTADEDVNGDGDWSNDDTDIDGIVDYLDDLDDDGPLGDPDHDGLTNAQEGRLEYNPALADTDGDGLPDGVEDPDGTGPNNDGDALLDALDPDDDNDGVPTSEEGSFDADGDGKPNYLDDDSDNDGVLDGDEQAGPPGERYDIDSDCDGAVDRFDGVDDGLCDRDTSATLPPVIIPTDAKGCQCGSGEVQSAWWLGLLPLALLRRRREVPLDDVA